MRCLGVPTTSSPTLCVGDERIRRDKYYTGDVSMEPVAVISRAARTFFRFGSFEICKPTDEKTGRAGPSAGDQEPGRKVRVRCEVAHPMRRVSCWLCWSI